MTTTVRQKDRGELTERINFALTPKMAIEIAKYERRNRLHNQSEAVRRMIEVALEKENE